MQTRLAGVLVQVVPGDAGAEPAWLAGGGRCELGMGSVIGLMCNICWTRGEELSDFCSTSAARAHW